MGTSMGIGGERPGAPFEVDRGALVPVPVGVDDDSVDCDEDTDGVLEADEDFVVAGLVLVGVGSGGRNEETVPTVMVESFVVEAKVAVPDPVAERVREGGTGIEDVASGRGVLKEPVIWSMLKNGEKAT